MNPQKPTPATRTPEVETMAADWPMISALLDSTRGMRTAGKMFLPKHPSEDEESYQYRLGVSTLFNGFAHTVDTLSGKPFSQPLKLGDDVPATLVKYCEDIDLQGRNLQAFAHDVFKTALAYGESYVLVDYPKTPQIQTLADQRISGARPYCVQIKPECVIGWRTERINGVETLVQLRISEYVEEENGEWGVKVVRQIRVLEPDNYRIYRETEKKEWVEVESGPVSIGCIPFVAVYGSRTGYLTGSPPLLDLAYLNVEHWQSYSDQTNILHVARVPILFGAGFSEKTPIKIGSNMAVMHDDPNAKLGYVEHSGAAIEAGRQSLKDLEERMSLMGTQLLLRQSTQVTATEKRIDSDENNSVLSQMALNLEDSLEAVLEYMAIWDNQKHGGSIELVTNFTDPLRSMSVEDVLKAKALGILSAQTAFAEMQRRGIVRDELIWAEEETYLKAELPMVKPSVEPTEK